MASTLSPAVRGSTTGSTIGVASTLSPAVRGSTTGLRLGVIALTMSAYVALSLGISKPNVLAVAMSSGLATDCINSAALTSLASILSTKYSLKVRSFVESTVTGSTGLVSSTSTVPVLVSTPSTSRP